MVWAGKLARRIGNIDAMMQGEKQAAATPRQGPGGGVRVVEVPGFLGRPPCAALVDFFRENIALLAAENASPAFSNRQINYGRIPNTHPIKNLINQCRWRIADVIREAYGVRQVYPDYTDLVFWPPGDGMVVHADNANEDGSPNLFAWRTYSAVLYLNDAYQGGATYFPKLGVEVRPETGKLVVFGAGTEYQHGVRPVLSGERYTMPLWYTDQLRYVEL